jgi:hypothetical protein
VGLSFFCLLLTLVLFLGLDPTNMAFGIVGDSAMGFL